MPTTLIRGRYVICRVNGREQVELIENGAVLERDGVITAIGGFDALEANGPYDKIVGSAEHVVFPGLVDAHHHIGLTPLQHGSPDLPLELWIVDLMGARAVDPYLDTLYSGFELVRSGVTTVQHLPYPAPGPASNVLNSARQMIAAYKALGMRVSYNQSITDQNRIVYDDDERFIATLPEHLRETFRAMSIDAALPLEEYFDIFGMLSSEFETDPMVAIQLAPDNLHWCSDEALTRVRDFSRQHNVPLHMHLLETQYQKAYAHKRAGGSAVEYLQQVDLLGPSMTLGHGVWLTERDIELVAESGTRICHNCSSNMRLRSGAAPLNQLLAEGIEVGIGIDEAGINDDRDMLQELRMVLRTHRVPGMAPVVPTPAEVFRMGTEFGAKTTGFGEQVGIIEPGRSADLVLLRWDKLSFPYLDKDVPVVDALLQRGRMNDVDGVMVNGEMILEDGKFTRVDEPAALAELSEHLAAPVTDDEKQRRLATREARPYIEAFYTHYLDEGEREPHYRMNAKR